MKTNIKNLCLLPLLTSGLGLMLAGQVTAQTVMTLHSFAGNLSDGASPRASLILSGNTLYGTASSGGNSGKGTVFKVNTDGTGFTNLYSFTDYDNETNSDGVAPYAGLILSGNTLYGTASSGGSSGKGTLFKINTDGTGFTNLYSFTALPLYPGPFTNSDGAYPYGGLILSGNILYGTAEGGGIFGDGTVFAVHTDGTGFTNLHNFDYGSDGAYPYAGLILSGNTLYGTAYQGGSAGNGTVFALNTDGSGFTNLHSLSYTDGTLPYAGLILSGNTLYGTASDGGGGGKMGTVFAVHTDGTGFTNLYSFDYYGSNGAAPYGGLILSSNILYGTASRGGSSHNGTLFALTTNGTGFTNLHSFTGDDGNYPVAGVLLSGNTLYGTALFGGGSGDGTVFSLSLPQPRLTIIRSAANIILTWPTNAAGFNYSGYTLQSTTNLVSPVVWSAISPSPTIVNGQNIVTNPVSGTQKFYRLSQ